MRSALEFMSANKVLMQSLENKNRQALFEIAEPIFKYLKKKEQYPFLMSGVGR